jgi:transketolase
MLESWEQQVKVVAAGIRRRVLKYTLENNGGYLSQACSSADLLATLYTRLMNLGPAVSPPVPLPFPGVPGPGNDAYFTGAGYNGPHEPHLDRFFFSPVHYALVLYSTLIEAGRMAPAGLEMFNVDGSSVELIGAEHSPGHEVTAGSLGQCISQAAGISFARRLNGETGCNWVFMSDGEFQEGQVWEAFAAMSYHGIDNLAVFVDANAQQCDGAMEGVMSIEPLTSRLQAFGAVVREVDGHDAGALAQAGGQPWSGGPLVVVARTDPCRGLELLRERAPKLHYVRFKSDAEFTAYRQQLDRMERDAAQPKEGTDG